MKKVLSVFILALSASMVMAEDAPKFAMSVTSNSTVSAKVNANYELQVALPSESACTVDPSHLDLSVEMNDVASLGIVGKRTYNASLQTGISSTSVSLASWLSNLYGMTDTTALDVDIAGVKCAFNVSREDTVISAIPTDVEETRTAWQYLANNVVKTSTQAEDDGFILIKQGSSLKVGNEQMDFWGDVALFKGSWTMLEMMNAIVDSTYVGIIPEISDEETFITDIKLAEGSVVAMGQTVATIAKEVKVSFDCTEAFQDSAVNVGVLSGMIADISKEQSGGAKLYQLLRYAVKFANDVVGQANEGGVCKATVEFDGGQTSVENIANAPVVIKKFQNGQLVIVKDGKTFNAQGIEL